ncbi:MULTISPECIES: hypothetical protein [Spiroplasma]|nr:MULTISPECIES: hypothetical protein [Spiroplasma]MBH8622946.1 hypothetical protein [Spiroplasma sp. hyd1]UNF62017.1 hypothetical protein MNU24_00695 [Spiroplasma poulsonii]
MATIHIPFLADGGDIPNPPDWMSLADAFGAWMKPFFIAVAVVAGIASVGTLITWGWRFKKAKTAAERSECWEGLLGWFIGLLIICLASSIVAIIVSVVKTKT